MRTLVLALSLLCLPLPALASAPDAQDQQAAPAPAARVPATVLEHREQVTVHGNRRLSRDITWTVRVEDPEACAAGLITPSGLDGATDQGAMVLEDVLVLPPEVEAGDVFTLRAQQRGASGGHSGTFQTAPDLPVESAVLQVRAPSWVPLHVWYDPGGDPEYATRGTRVITIDWSDVGSTGGGQAVWSTWADWMEPGERLLQQMDGLMASKEQLGRVLAADIADLDVASVTGRVYQAVKLEPGPVGTWDGARPATEVARSGTASAADRGVLLISLLRLAGHDAVPGLFRPASMGGAFPVTVPAPAMLPRPVVVVRRADRRVYIDPAAELADVPDLPASIAGGSVWVPGDLPVGLQTPDLVDGTVTINSNLNLTADGASTWTATISASDTASEWIRELLAPLDEAGRVEALHRLARIARPDLQRFTASTSGVTRTDKRLKISLSGHDEGVLQPIGEGLTGEVQMLLAPAMAAWLPPNVRVRELLSISPPSTVQVLAVDSPQSTFAEEALITRSHRRQGQRQVLEVEIERPYRATTAALDSAARRFLEAEARQGFELILFAGANGKTARSIQQLPDRSEAERVVLEALLWWSTRKEARALKVLRKSEVPLDDLLQGVERYASPGYATPWRALARVADEREDPAGRLKVAESMARRGLMGPALEEARTLSEAEAPEVRALALLLMERLQGPAPAEAQRGAHPWVPPEQLVEQAGATAPDHPAVVLRQARQALDEGRFAEAEAMLEGVAGRTDDPAVQVLLAQAASGAGLAVADVQARILAALHSSPHDPQVVGLAAHALSALGLTEDAARLGLTAARMRPDDPQPWSEAVQLALHAGELPTAAYAARRASELDPDNPERGRWFGILSTLVGDRKGAELGLQRAGDPEGVGSWPPDMDTLLWMTPGEALYALLVHHDEATVDSPKLLAMRAQMRLERGHLDEAARDGILLARRHDQAEGMALAFAATAGRLYASTSDQILNDAAKRDPVARLTRMEYRLITGDGDATQDARDLEGARADVVNRLRSRPAEVAAEVEGWPEALGRPSGGAPAGFRYNRLLSSVPGVSAWSDPAAAVAVLRIGGITGLLPPPLSNLYTPVEPPLKAREDGVQILRLQGGVLPMFAAVAVRGQEEVVGIGFSQEAAERAIDRALGR